MDYDSVNYDPNPNIDYSSDPNLAYEYLSQSTREPVLRYGTDIPYGTPTSQLVNYVPAGASTIILWDPATMLFQLAINYGLYGGWYFYPRWYDFRSIYYRYPRNWIGFRTHIYDQYNGYVRGHGASRNMGRDFYDRYENRHRRGTSPILNRSARTTSPVLNRSSPLNRNSRATSPSSSPVRSIRPSSPVLNRTTVSPSSSPLVRRTSFPVLNRSAQPVRSISPSSSPVIRRTSSPVLDRTAQPVRSVSPVLNRTRSVSPSSSSPVLRRTSSPVLTRTVNVSPSSSPTVRGTSPPVLNRTAQPVRSVSPIRMSRSPSSSPVSYRMPSMMRSSPIQLSRAQASSPRTVSRSFSSGRPPLSGGGRSGRR